MWEEHSYQNEPGINMTDRTIDYINGGKQREVPISDTLMEDYKKQYFNYQRLMQEGPAFSTANSVLNADPTVQEPKAKTNKTKEAQPTTGEPGTPVAVKEQKSHKETVHSVYESAHDARGFSGNIGQLKSRVQTSSKWP